MRSPDAYSRGMVLDPRAAIALTGAPDPTIIPRFGGTGEIGPTSTVEDTIGPWLDAWPVRDQQQTNYCTRYAVCGALELWEAREMGQRVSYLSPHFLAWVDDPSYRGRNLGQAIYISADAARRYGVCSDMEFPSATLTERPQDRVSTAPDRTAYTEAERHQVLQSYRIEDGDLPAVYAALVQGHSVVFGMYLREGFYTRTGVDGIVKNTGNGVGWHAMLCVALVTVGGVLYALTRNSYGTDFGHHGYVLIPMDEMEKARDLRVFTNLELPTR